MDGWIATGSDDVFAAGCWCTTKKNTDQPTAQIPFGTFFLVELLRTFIHSSPAQEPCAATATTSGRVLTKILILPRGLSPLALIYRPTHVLLNGPTNFNVGEIGFEWGPAEFRIPISRSVSSHSSPVVFRANSKAYITHYIPKVVLLWNVLFIRSSAYTPLGMMRKAHGLNILLWAYYN